MSRVLPDEQPCRPHIVAGVASQQLRHGGCRGAGAAVVLTEGAARGAGLHALARAAGSCRSTLQYEPCMVAGGACTEMDHQRGVMSLDQDVRGAHQLCIVAVFEHVHPG